MINLIIGQKIQYKDEVYGIINGEVMNITETEYWIKWEDISVVSKHKKSHSKDWESLVIK